MPINNPNPITIPPVAGTTADALWIKSLTINAPSTTGKVAAVAQIVPYSSSTGVMLNEQVKLLTIPDVFAAAASDTHLATAMTALFTAIQSQVIAKNLFPTS